MKKSLFILALLVINLVHAQEIKFNPKTGDVEMDGFLTQINNEAKKDLSAFTGQVANKFNVAKNDIDKLLKDMAPGDVYMSAQVADIIKKPVTEVSTTYTKNKSKGWGEIAKEMGIKPGSAEFHQLKKSMKKPGGDEGKDEGEGAHGNGHGNGHGHGNGGHGKK
ncbi:MAG: hypothetical protein ACXVC6_02055 [Bacteroidia bacterium]